MISNLGNSARRNSIRAVVAAATALSAMVVGGAAMAASTGPSATIVSSAATHRTQELAALRRLVVEIAAPAHGRVQVTVPAGETDEPTVEALVQTPAGAFTVGAGLGDAPGGVAQGAEACRLDGQGPDRICRILVDRSDLGLWDRTYPGQPGRRDLRLAADSRAGGTLYVTINNLTETPSGEKPIGPDWRQAGITVAGVRLAVAHSGLTR
jgi:hypothetical protein